MKTNGEKREILRKLFPDLWRPEVDDAAPLEQVLRALGYRLQQATKGT